MITDHDERAAILLDELLRGRAQRLKDVKDVFEREGIWGCVDHIRRYPGASITRIKIAGDIWVYKNSKQKLRIKQNAAALRILNEYLQVSEDSPVPLPISFFKEAKNFRSQNIGSIDKVAREMGLYIVGGEWQGTRYLRGGTLQYCGEELMPEDRQWMLKEFKWMIEESGWSLGEIDPEEIWDKYEVVFSLRVNEAQVRRWVTIVNGRKDIDVFLSIESIHGY